MAVKKCCVCGRVRWVRYVATTNEMGKQAGIDQVEFPLCMKCYIDLMRKRNENKNNK